MGYKGYRVVVVTPAGRRRYMQLLLPQVLAYAPVVDEYRLWLNTSDADDLAWMRAAAEDHALVTTEALPAGITPAGNTTICRFFRNCVDPYTVYVRLDDDVVLLDDIDAFRAFLDFRLADPGPFLTYGTIMNNAVCAWLLQHNGRLGTSAGLSGYLSADPVGWKDGPFVKDLHDQVLASVESGGDLTAFRWPGSWTVLDYTRVSINCIAWLGADFATFGGAVDPDEEEWLSVVAPRARGRPNAIFGGFVVAHYAFFTQRDFLDRTDVLARYARLVRAKLLAAGVQA